MKDLIKILRSFRYAYDGLKYALLTQHNMRFHFFASFIVLLLGLALHLSKTDVLFLFLAITLVIITELINTAVEKTVDLATSENHPLAKFAKDAAAASVLVSAVFAAVVGFIIFYHPMDRLLHRIRDNSDVTSSAEIILLFLVLVVFSIIVLEVRFSQKKQKFRPSLWTAAAFSISTITAILVLNTAVYLLSYILSFFIMFILYDKKERPIISLITGAIIGIAIAVTGFYFIQLGGL